MMLTNVEIHERLVRLTCIDYVDRIRDRVKNKPLLNKETTIAKLQELSDSFESVELLRFDLVRNKYKTVIKGYYAVLYVNDSNTVYYVKMYQMPRQRNVKISISYESVIEYSELSKTIDRVMTTGRNPFKYGKMIGFPAAAQVFVPIKSIKIGMPNLSYSAMKKMASIL